MPKLANPTQPMRWGNSTPKSLVGGGNWDFIYFFGVELGVLNVFHMVPSSSHQVPNGYLLCFSVASSIWFLQVPTQVPSSKFTYSEFRFSVGGGGSRFETDSVNPTPPNSFGRGSSDQFIGPIIEFGIFGFLKPPISNHFHKRFRSQSNFKIGSY